MEFKNIKELIALVGEGNVSEVKIENGDFKLIIKGNVAAPVVVAAPQAPVVMAAPVASATPAPVAAPPTLESKPAAAAAEEKPAGNLKEFRSPMVGTFYRSPGPGKAAFVQVGDSITKGQAVCIIEAMKLFNELEADFGGKIVKILAEDATPVEYDQPLFLIEV